MTHKNVWIFQKAELKENTLELDNPARGWYRIYTFLLEEELDFEALKWSVQPGESIVLVLMDIHSYREKTLDESALGNCKKILKFFKKQKKDVILRVVYDRFGKGKEAEPATFSLVRQHLQQICMVIKNNENSVFLFQGMLLGSWGEMHDSKFLDASHIRVLWQDMKDIAGKNCFFAVRTSKQRRILVKEDEKENQLGVFDDGIFGSPTHLGTFGTMCKEAAGWEGAWTRKEELDFIEYVSESVPSGGEAVAEINHDGILSSKAIIQECRKMHLTYLNCTHDMQILNQWKKTKCGVDGIWKEESLYSYIGAHLGYRFQVKNVNARVLLFHQVQFWIEIGNIGFGRLYEEAEVFLNIIDSELKISTIVPVDLSTIKPGEWKRVVVSTKAQHGNVYLKARRKKDHREITFCNKNTSDGIFIGCL